MIFFKPTVSEENPSVISFEAIENDVVHGKCTLFLNGNKAEIIALECDENALFIAEGLIKSAFNFACNKNCYMGYCKIDNLTLLLDRMNLQKENGVYFNDIPSILQGNCCKKH